MGTAEMSSFSLSPHLPLCTGTRRGHRRIHYSPIRSQAKNTVAAADDMATSYDRAAEVKQFDESKVGVKGLLDSGITAIPRFFHHLDLDLDLDLSSSTSSLSIPTIDLSLSRPQTLAAIRAACREWGFFQVTNHGIPAPAIDAVLSAIQSFNELPADAKSRHYTRDVASAGGVVFNTNVDLYKSEAASWRDTLQLAMAPVPPAAERIPEACRAEVLAWDSHVREAGRALMGLLSEGLAVEKERLEGMTLLDGRVMVCHYYPPCPQPELTLGLAGHTDPGGLTVLVQNHVGGLQVKKTEGPDCDKWVDVEPIPGALIINVGDLLQIISNDEYKSVVHRVVANSHRDPRVSIAVFFNPGQRGDSDYYEPLPELVESQGTSARYRRFTVPEFMRTFFSKELSSRALVDHFRI